MYKMHIKLYSMYLFFLQCWGLIPGPCVSWALRHNPGPWIFETGSHHVAHAGLGIPVLPRLGLSVSSSCLYHPGIKNTS
jgi:hypothetical protein